MTAWWLTVLSHGLAMTAAIAILLRGMRRLSGATRYWIWSITFTALVASVSWSGATQSASSRDVAAYVSEPAPLVYVPSLPESGLLGLVLVWALVAAYLLVRTARSLYAIGLLKKHCRPVSPQLEAELPLWLQVRRQGRRVMLSVCDCTVGPAVLGFLRPTIVLPCSLVDAMTREELDQIVLHEYAHVQRRDDWFRLVQVLIESLAWIHPAIRFVGRRLTFEREVACDEWVVARTHRAQEYALCLARAAELQGPAALVGPAFFTKPSEIVGRVDRLLSKRPPGHKVSPIAVGACTCALVAMAAQLPHVPLVSEIGEVLALTAPVAPAAAVGPAPIAPAAPDTHGPAEAGHYVRSGGAGPGRYVRAGGAGAGHFVRAGGAGAGHSVRPRVTRDAPMALDAPIAPDKLDAPLAGARSFHGHYVTLLPREQPANPRSRWQAGAVAGAEIADAAVKTGVGMAHTFARAGVSLAGRF